MRNGRTSFPPTKPENGRRRKRTATKLWDFFLGMKFKAPLFLHSFFSLSIFWENPIQSRGNIYGGKHAKVLCAKNGRRGRRGRGWIMLSSPGGGEATLQGTIFAGIRLPATFRPKGEEASKEKVFFTLQARRGAGTGETGKESQMNAEPAMK